MATDRTSPIPAGDPPNSRRVWPAPLAAAGLALFLGLTAWGFNAFVKLGPHRDRPEWEVCADGRDVPGWGRVSIPDARNCTVQVDGGRVRFELPANTTSFVSSSYLSYDPPQVAQQVTGDFRVRVRVGPFVKAADRPEDSARLTAGLLVWADDTHFARMERSNEDILGGDTLNGVRVISPVVGGLGTSAVSRLDPSAWCHLELERRGNQFRARASTDGQAWSAPVSLTVSGLPATVRVGVTAFGAGATQPFSVEFDGFEVVPLPTANR